MTWCVLEPARRLGGWNEEVKEEMARKKLVRCPGKVTQSLPGLGEKVGHFILVPKELLKVRSGGRDMTVLEFWKLGMENARGKGGTAGWVAREEPPQNRCERKREGGSADEGEAGFQNQGPLSALPSPGLKEHLA